MKEHSLIRGVVITLVSFLLILFILLLGLTTLSSQSETKLSESLKASVLRSTLTCYAVEGRYPADAEYLETHYGLTYDHSQYIVSLDSFADNLLPDISVLRIGEV
jgi:hypothetical protein